MTPEGKVKAKVNKTLDKYDLSIYRFMAVPGGYGKSTIDYLCCFRGLFFAIETKRAGGTPTPRQEGIIEDIEAAGGKVFRISDDAGVEELALWLEAIEDGETS